MNCPSCGHALEVSELDHISVHDCPDCRGIWFEGDELRKAKANADQWVRWIDFDVFKAAEAAPDRKGKRCPKCGSEMATLTYPHSKVEIDACASDHGVWLDRGEFDKLIKDLDDLTNTLSARDYEHAAAHQLREVFSGHESRLSEIRDFMAVFRLLEMRVGVEHPGAAAMVNTASSEGL